MSSAEATGAPWVLVPRNLNAMLTEADLELRAIAEVSAQDATRITRAKTHGTPPEAPAVTVTTRAEFDALVDHGAAFDAAEHAHDQAVAMLDRAQASLAEVQAEQARRTALMAKAKLWRQALVALIVLLGVWLVW